MQDIIIRLESPNMIHLFIYLQIPYCNTETTPMSSCDVQLVDFLNMGFDLRGAIGTDLKGPQDLQWIGTIETEGQLQVISGFSTSWMAIVLNLTLLKINCSNNSYD